MVHSLRKHNDNEAYKDHEGKYYGPYDGPYTYNPTNPFDPGPDERTADVEAAVKGKGPGRLKPNVKGKLKPIKHYVFVKNMRFDDRMSKGGIIIPNDDGKSEGVRHRWGEVYAVGPEQHDLKIGDWILVEHGRWTRGILIEDEEEGDLIIRKIDTKAILMVSDEDPSDNTFGQHSKVQHQTFNFG
jgi:co-chaperonin GroES (HSP10)